jgi:hypothetical protein
MPRHSLLHALFSNYTENPDSHIPSIAMMHNHCLFITGCSSISRLDLFILLLYYCMLLPPPRKRRIDRERVEHKLLRTCLEQFHHGIHRQLWIHLPAQARTPLHRMRPAQAPRTDILQLELFIQYSSATVR